MRESEVLIRAFDDTFLLEKTDDILRRHHEYATEIAVIFLGCTTGTHSAHSPVVPSLPILKLPRTCVAGRPPDHLLRYFDQRLALTTIQEIHPRPRVVASPLPRPSHPQDVHPLVSGARVLRDSPSSVSVRGARGKQLPLRLPGLTRAGAGLRWA